MRWMGSAAVLCVLVGTVGGCATRTKEEAIAADAAKARKYPLDKGVMAVAAPKKAKPVAAPPKPPAAAPGGLAAGYGAPSGIAAGSGYGAPAGYAPAGYGAAAVTPVGVSYPPQPQYSPQPAVSSAPQFVPADDFAYAQPASSPLPAPSRHIAPAPAPSGGRKNYVVRKGDTLFGIARAHYGSGGQWSRLVSANPGLSPASLQAGATIVVP